MDYLPMTIAIVTYFAVLGLGITCAWLMHRRSAARARKADFQRAKAAESFVSRSRNIA
jgi:hypothetical protein